MKIQTRITLIQIAIFLIFILLFFILQNIEKKQNENILESVKLQQKETAERIIKLKTSFVEKIIHDYTYWDECYNFFQKPDTTWANENLATLLTTLDIKCIIAYSLEKEIVFQKFNDAPPPYPNIFFSDRLFDELYKKREFHFYYYSELGIIEFCGATVHKTNDPKKIQSPNGYLFIGSLIDEKYADEISSLSQNQVYLSRTKTEVSNYKTICTTSFPINDFDNNNLGYLNFVKENKLIGSNDKLIFYSRFYLFLCAFLIVGLFVFSYRIYINKPLKAITETLKTNQPSHLNQLYKDKHEFGQIAFLIQDFFNQKKELEQEIIEHRVTEEKLIKSESRLKDLFELLPQIVFETQIDGKLTFVNKTAIEITGYSLDDFYKGLYVYLLVSPNEKERALKNMHLIANGLKSNDKEYNLIRKDGSTIQVLINTTSIVINGVHSGFRGIITDITQLKEQEEKLRRSEELYKLIVDISTDVFYTISIDGIILSLSNSFEKFLGWKKDFWIGKCFIDIIHPEDIAFAKEIHQLIIEGKRPPTFEHRIRKLDGSYANVEFSAAPLYQNNEIIGTIGSAIDITLRKKTIEQLRQSEDLYLKTINSLYTWLHVVNKDLEIIFLNDSLDRANKEIYGNFNAKGMLLNEAYPFINPKVIDEYRQIFKDGKEIFAEESLKIGKKLFYLETKRVPVFSGTEVDLVVTTMRDVTDQKLFEQKILRTTIETQEKERKRFAEDLHDGLGPLLSSIKLYINELVGAATEEEKNSLLATSNELIDEAVSSAKAIANNLMPNTLSDFGLIPAIKAFCIRLNSSKAINISFNTKNLETRFNKNVEISIYRIISELINNTIKHASAKNINIYLEKIEQKLNIAYEDDGIGFNVNEIINNKSQAMGINNIRSRVNALQGKFEINSSPNNGCKISIKLFLDLKFNDEY